MAEAFAPAKINLTLHVTGRRSDGYHLLDSLVAFADGIGDRLSLTPAAQTRLDLSGPEAEGLRGAGNNLVLHALRLFGPDGHAHVHLEKRLPIASGIGGGSADAAACLRAYSAATGRALPRPQAVAALGADVPVCLAGRPARMRGIGDLLEPVPALPALDLVLVNPRREVPTAAVFAALPRADNPGMGALPDSWGDAAAFCGWLARRRNDLEGPARALVPEIGAGLAALRRAGALFAGMSGSGATCFGLFATGDAPAAAARLSGDLRGWWVAAGGLSSGG